MSTKEVYPYLCDGQPWRVSKDEGVLQSCCDCGLVHKITFEDHPVNSQWLIMRWRRDTVATTTQRRLRGVAATTTGKGGEA